MNTLSRRARGVTLIELAFVISIIAIIVVAALAIFNAVSASQNRTTALQNVGSIRAAVSTWAGDKSLDFDEADGLQDLSQLRPWLPGRLGTNAAAGLMLSRANPWQGDYEIQSADAGATGAGPHPYRFVLVIHDVPGAEAQALCRQLVEGAALDMQAQRMIAYNARGSTGCRAPASGGEDEPASNEPIDIYIEYGV